MSSDTARREEIELLREELAELDVQVSDGELDAATAERLAARYRTRLTELEREDAEAVADSEPDSEPDSVTSRSGRRVSGRALAGIAVVGLALVGITWFAVSSLDDAGTAGAEGVVDDVLGDGGDVDLSEITDEQMEQVVAENPEVVGMRLALARRYFEAGRFDRALDHYFEVLEREQHPEALANVGWMTYLSDRPDVALGYLEAALQRQPDYLPAQWFIANVLVTLGRQDDAVPYLTALLRSADVPEAITDNAAELLAQIEAGS